MLDPRHGSGNGRIVLGALVALVACLRPASAGTLTVEGKHVTINSTVEYRPTVERCRDLLESALAIYEKHLPAYRLAADAKLVLNLYATKDEYAAAIKRVGGENFVENQACTAASNKESYVVLQPRSDPEYLELVGNLPELTADIICHEGVHQWLRRCGAPNVDSWPFWYEEGLAVFLAEQCLRADNPKATFSIRAEDTSQRVSEALSTGTMLTLPRLLHADSKFDKWNVLYAHSYSFYRFLAQDAGRLAKLHDGIRRLGGSGGAFPVYDHAQASARVVSEVYGPLDVLEEKWRDDVKKQSQRWFEHRRASQSVGDEIVCASFPGEMNAILISAQPTSGAEFTVSCELNILGLGDKQAEIYLGFERRDDTRFLKLAIGADGYVTLLGFSDGYWRPQLKKSVNVAQDLLPVGKWIPVRATVKKDAIRVEVQGKGVFETPVPPGFDVLHGRWGIGALSEVVRYRKLSTSKAP